MGPEIFDHVHEFASRANAHTHVIILGRTTSRDVWVGVRCAVGEGERWSAARSIFLYFVTPHILVRPRCYRFRDNRFRDHRVVALREVALFVVVISPCIRITCAYIHR